MTMKTRIRVARIAAGVVIAAGASLTAAGVASASGDDGGVGIGVTLPDGDPSATPTETGIPSGPASPTTEPATTPPATPTIPSTPTGPATPTTTPPTDEPTDPTENPTEPTDPTDSPTDGSGTGTGGNDSNPDGGSKPVEQGKGSSGLTDTGANTSSDTSAQGKKGQLAETGAAETTFLLVGAATMIAGGIGFRLLPRLVNGRGAAA
ncbi:MULTISPECIES: LPXTG cell wall anchor domain-containing protein [Streptomyces]|uniref:LPXTG cell wall anchor domain-containing protein n=1 Tax=Streptomyces TaxID=1883 RepID=UPI0011657D7A|nr:MULTISPECIES: LPXTG cell wall anchor domain-containing protein [unclassified Streptomyces]NMI58714.1 LPXTG cell wall anchor domain-containing protein [Streptomyces sp. RLA2-12]QDN58027.1 LPXTG cell wall anchor domain-containing protein [Streptomyces sp. S1D4-20]QDN68123.1 LPXTG cell wall anchor domain-containing protein [Streptomyces sp. S1D4-14]QDN98743.1 LPXTG cell wall anchor domain-containing protein [Streptomyces sp. RLB1-9]QDO20457.1 LPXTG cell wall anchor domain-containing protein [S